ncbi:FecR family protein [Carboxylicivirga linearis]|uniref:DUF4974 domain-containing protein n=1 Tax=Carboxylicivirga linearis TaxID=1628157 RepID=A0ABS5JTD6_9BACT|nr:FecR domain-containing protein [Carboxylicivirga linearis]MBS2098112.1 DUF4974 domain-containing protein [Carboxylicivirga linearis]
MEDKQLKDLVERFYNGTISAREEEVLFKKVKTDKGFGLYFNKYDDQYLLLQNNENEADVYWKSFKSKYLKRTKDSKEKRILPWIKYVAVAAVTLVMFNVGQYFYNKACEVDTYANWCEMIVPKGEKSQVILPDGTHIWLNSESYLKYPTHFGSKERKVVLEGEAYFKVAKNKDVPFLVKTKDYVTRVLGTEFNVMSYSDFDRTETTLKEGSVSIEVERGEKIAKVAVLRPGQKISYSKLTKKYSVIETDPDQVIAWKNNVFEFDKITLKELVLRLERWYDVNIELQDAELAVLRYTGKFKNEESIRQVLDIIKITTPINYVFKDRKMIIIKKKTPM